MEVLFVELGSAFEPHSRFLQLWHQWLLLGLLAQGYILPFAIAFLPPPLQPQDSNASTAMLTPSTVRQQRELQLFFLVELMFVLDLVAATFRLLRAHASITTIPRRVLLALLLDVAALVPLSLLLPAPSFHHHVLVRELHKLVRIRHIPKLLSSLDEVYTKQFAALKFLKVVVTTLVLAHAAACARFALQQSGQSSMIQADKASSSPTSYVVDAYARSLVLSMGMLTGILHGALPRSSIEFVFTMCVCVGGFAVFVYLCSTLFALSNSASNHAEIAQARINHFTHLLSYHHVPENLEAQVVQFVKVRSVLSISLSSLYAFARLNNRSLVVDALHGRRVP
jgi:hypothetical protein